MKNFNPLISIIIPVYNGENYIKEAIDSALNQTYKNIEIIVVNDGSTDKTEEIAKSYKDKICYFSKENGGVASALNLAINNANGEYISWLSHDDIYAKDKLAKQIKKLTSLPEKNTIIFSNYLIFNQDTGNVDKIDIRDFGYNADDKKNILKMLFLSTIHGCTLLIPSICFNKCGNFDIRLKTTQDYDLWFKFINAGFNFCFVNDILVKGREHRRQDSKTKISLCNKEKKELFTKNFFIFFTELLRFNKQDIKALKTGLKCSKLKHLYFLFYIIYTIKNIFAGA